MAVFGVDADSHGWSNEITGSTHYFSWSLSLEEGLKSLRIAAFELDYFQNELLLKLLRVAN